MSEEAKMTVTVIPAKPKEELESARARALRKTNTAVERSIYLMKMTRLV